MQALKLIDAPAVPPHVPCATRSPAHTVFLLSKTPTVPLPPDSSPVHRTHLICPPDNLQEIHWIAERGPD